MTELKTTRPLSTKAFEICYAAFRVGSSIENRVLAEHLEAWALSLLGAVNNFDQERGSVALLNLHYLVSLARDLNLLNLANSELFLGEIETMKSAIAEYSTHQSSDLDLSKMFTRESTSSVHREEHKANPAESKESVEPYSVNIQNNGTLVKSVPHSFSSIPQPTQDKNDNSANNPAIYFAKNSAKSEERQSAMIERIRQNNVCRLRDMQEMFPDTSERTLRYDMQNLIEGGNCGKNWQRRTGNGISFGGRKSPGITLSLILRTAGPVVTFFDARTLP